MVSLVLNCDTRPAHLEFQGLTKGPRSRDFIGREALESKRKFFDGFDIELIAHIDEHEPLTHEQYDVLHELCDCVVIRKHTKHYRGNNPCNGFNDINYLQALSMARGQYVAHFDQDMFCYAADRTPVEMMLDEVNSGRHKIVCYPSNNSPHPCHAPEYEGRFWASTRFFFCKRETLDFTVLEHAIREPQWLYENFSRPPRECPWTEQFLGIMAGYSVLYPKPEIDKYVICPWMSYRDGTLDKLAEMPYGAIANAFYKAGGAGLFWDGVSSEQLVP